MFPGADLDILVAQHVFRWETDEYLIKTPFKSYFPCPPFSTNFEHSMHVFKHMQGMGRETLFQFFNYIGELPESDLASENMAFVICKAALYAVGFGKY